MKLRINVERRKSDQEVAKKSFVKAYSLADESRITRMMKIIKSSRINISSVIYRSKWIAVIIALFGIIVSLYYSYLNNLYLIDEVYDGEALREYSMEEKLTIFVTAPTNSPQGLKKFVECYSLCQSVHEIVIIWNQQKDKKKKEKSDTDNNSHKDDDSHFPNVNTYFRFMHTHSKVKFTYTYLPDDAQSSSSNSVKSSHHLLLAPVSYAQFLYDQQLIETSSVMFLDADVSMSCDDVAFSQNVWRSANESVVGFFPRSHSLSPSGASSTSSQTQPHITFAGPMSVWRTQKYSLLLPAGTIVGKHLLWVDSGRTIVNSSSGTDSAAGGDASVETRVSQDITSAELKLLLNILQEKPECTKVAFSLYAAFLHAAPPVWVDIPCKIDHSIKLPTLTASSSKTIQQQHTAEEISSQCMNQIILALKLDIEKQLPYSYHKASPAKTHLIW